MFTIAATAGVDVKTEHEWRQRERLVALIEKSLSSDAVVEHDVRLPVIGRNRTRQCDVIVRYGSAPRTSLAIVEVQKRNRPPDITTFHGWVQKMREVGAQQLFCVSEKGYPRSIVDEVATKFGPTVKLLTLQDLQTGSALHGHVLVPIVFKTFPKYCIRSLGPAEFEQPTAGIQVSFGQDEPIFTLSGEAAPLSLNDLIVRALERDMKVDFPPPHQRADWSQSVDVVIDGSRGLHIRLNGLERRVMKLPVGLLITCEAQTESIPVHQLSYNQVNCDGVLAWVATTQFLFQGELVRVTLIVRPDENGFLTSVNATAAGVETNRVSVHTATMQG